MPDMMRAVSVGRARRRPRTYGEDRVCGEGSCDTRLSRYNRESFCFQHAPVKFRRIRGEFSPEWVSERP